MGSSWWLSGQAGTNLQPLKPASRWDQIRVGFGGYDAALPASYVLTPGTELSLPMNETQGGLGKGYERSEADKREGCLVSLFSTRFPATS